MKHCDECKDYYIGAMMLVKRMAIILIINSAISIKENKANCNDDLGSSNVAQYAWRQESNTNRQYFMTDNVYVAGCCGVLKEWKLYAGATGTITLQVWRPSGGSSVELAGENTITISSTGTYTYEVPTADRIEVETGDFIGWYTSGTDIVRYRTTGNMNDNNYIESLGTQPSVGDTVSYSNRYTDRTYAIYGEVNTSDGPDLTNLPATENDYASMVTSGKSMFTVTASDPLSIFALDNISPSAHFTINSATGEVTATSSSVSATTYTLTISVTTSCSSTNSEDLTIALLSTAPVWSNLDATISVSKTAMSTTMPAYTVEATNPVVDGSVTYTLQSITPNNGDFDVGSGTGEVTPTQSQVTGGTYTLNIRAHDIYGNYVDGTLTISVVNLPPEITSLPDVVDISESAVDQTLLHIINVTDADGDLVTCSMTSSPSGPFITKYMVINGEFKTGIYLQANPTIDYDTTNAYEISVDCTDGEASSDTKILYVYVTPNNVPVITNLQNNTAILSTTPTSTIIFQVLSTDEENDETYYTLSCAVTSPCPFIVFSDGSIALTISLYSSSTKAYEVDISVRDQFSSSGTHRLTVFVSDLNTQPELNNLPASLQIPEDTTVGTTIFDISAYDEDGDTSHTFAVSFSPASSSALFHVNTSTGEVILSTALNYLTQANSYTLTIEVSDAQVNSAPQTLIIDVVDVNQTPVLYQTNYQIQIDEGVPAGTSAPDPGFNAYDPDDDILTYSFDGTGGVSDTSGFAIDSSTGIISTTIDIDVDDTSVNTLYIWLVVISDPEGLSCTATLTLSIIDTNDNIPTFDSIYYASTISTNTEIGAHVLQLTATDNDRTEVNRVIQFGVSGTTLFGIDNAGSIFVSHDLEPYKNTVETFKVKVRNPDSASANTATVAISIEAPQSDDEFFDDAANIVWVTLLCVLGLVFLSVIAYLSYQAFTKPSSIAVTKPSVIQVAPSDTKMPPDSVQNSRISMVSRGSNAVTPSDIRIIHSRWDAWQAGWDV